MLLRSTTEDEKANPLFGGARAVRPWGGSYIGNKPTPALR